LAGFFVLGVPGYKLENGNFRQKYLALLRDNSDFRVSETRESPKFLTFGG